MGNLIKDYSGIIVNQNQKIASANDKVNFVDHVWMQEFFLPSDYARGSGTSRVIPSLSGFHLGVEVQPGNREIVGFNWRLDNYIIGSGWSTLASGKAIQAPGEDALDVPIWMEAYFDSLIEISEAMLNDKFRLRIWSATPVSPVRDQEVIYDPVTKKITWDSYSLTDILITPGERQYASLRGNDGWLYQRVAGEPVYYTEWVAPDSIWFSQPNPFALQFIQATREDGTLVSNPGDHPEDGPTSSFMFRVLALTADEGVDFLGNSFRSAVTRAEAENANTVDGDKVDAIWMSKPNPSRFAVESLYYDVRRNAPTYYPKANLVKSPSAESTITDWTNGYDGTTTGLTLSTTWKTEGEKSFKIAGTSDVSLRTPGLVAGPLLANLIPVTEGQTYSLAADYNIVVLPASSTLEEVKVEWFDSAGSPAGTSIVYTSASPTTGVKHKGETFVAPATAAYAQIWVYIDCQDAQAYEMYVDAILFCEGGLPPVEYFDGDYPGYEWDGAKDNSVSYNKVDTEVLDEAVVIDQVLIDPITPGVFFHIYYSNETDVEPDSEEKWENKLWTRVPGTFQANGRETHVLPSPITAKYVKVEFSHLQAKSYTPGDLARKSKYKKHPRWVLEYFMARVESRNSLEAKLMNKTVGIVFDAYDLAYNYYLDDLGQEPDLPAEIAGSSAVLGTYLKENTYVDVADPAMITKIKTVLDPYKGNITDWVDPSSVLGTVVINNTNESSVGGGSFYTTEVDRGGSSNALSLRSTEVAFENDFPVMFFYLTCRHKYREIVAEFSHDRAYFVGIRQIAFGRNNYTTQYDTGLYIESAGDLTNIERNDFVLTDGIMVTG